MEKSIVVLYDDFGEDWIEPLVKSGAARVGLHANPFTASVDDFLRAVDDLRVVTDALERRGIAVEYYLHAAGYLLPRGRFALRPDWFRVGTDGQRTPDYNCCPSNEEALEAMSEQTTRLASRLQQRSHRYHLWQDDDLGGDIACCCEKCRVKTPTAQNLALAEAMLRGLRVYDPRAEIALLVYGEQGVDVPLPDGVFLEWAPFTRAHDLPLTQSETNRAFRGRLQQLLHSYPTGRLEVLEYFLSYDYADFCLDGERVRQDVDDYRGLGIARLATFAVFPQRGYLKAHGWDGIYKYFDL